MCRYPATRSTIKRTSLVIPFAGRYRSRIPFRASIGPCPSLAATLSAVTRRGRQAVRIKAGGVTGGSIQDHHRQVWQEASFGMHRDYLTLARTSVSSALCFPLSPIISCLFPPYCLVYCYLEPKAYVTARSVIFRSQRGRSAAALAGAAERYQVSSEEHDKRGEAIFRRVYFFVPVKGFATHAL